MKNFKCLSFIFSTIFLLVILFTSNTNATPTILPEDDFVLSNGVRGNMTEAEIFQVIGRGQKTSQYISSLKYSFGDVTFNTMTKRAAQIDVNSPIVSTFRGVKVGDSVQKLFSLYPYTEFYSMENIYVYHSPNGKSHLEFSIKPNENIIYKITLFGSE